ALRAPRRSFLALDPALRSEVLRWAIAELQGDTRGLEWAHLRGALETIERGRGGAVAWLSPCLHLRLERSQIVIEQRHPGAMPDNEVARPEPCNP
ncbi:MAG: TilS substrate-binding domain-containing protein, partial [Chloroflexota bacterium]